MDPSEFLRGIDIYLYRTHPDFAETWGRCITEAMAAGCAVVAEARGGIPAQIVDGQTGLLCSTEDEFAAAMNRLRDASELRRLGENAATHAAVAFGLPALRAQLTAILMKGRGANCSTSTTF
jgi:glycosyltransferase involved in cell wall biosynthesis